MNKIFYDPITLEIKGFSDGEVSMELPYLETNLVPYPIENFQVIINGDHKELQVLNTTLT